MMKQYRNHSLFFAVMKKILAFFVLTLSFFVLTACSADENEDPQTVINRAWEKMADENAGKTSGEIIFSGTVKAAFEKSTANLEGNGSLLYDSKNLANPKTSLKISLKGKADIEGKAGDVDVKGELRSVDKQMYFFLENVVLNTPDPQTNLITNLLSNLYKSQWISFPFSAPAGSVEPAPISPEEIATIAKANNFLVAEKNLGKRTYEVRIDQEKFQIYLQEVSKLMGSPLTSEALVPLNNLLQQLDYTAEVSVDGNYDFTWVSLTASTKPQGTEDKLEVKLKLNFDDEETESTFSAIITGSSPGNFDLSLKTDHQDTSVTIEAPKDAKPFDFGSLLNAQSDQGDQNDQSETSTPPAP